MKQLVSLVFIILTIYTTSVLAIVTNPPSAPSIYASGPIPRTLNKTDISTPELLAFSMLEGIFQMTETTIHSKGCVASTGVYDIDLYADNDPAIINFAIVTSPGGSYNLDGTKAAQLAHFGDKVSVKQNPLTGQFDQQLIKNFDASYSFNSKKDMMVGESKVEILGARGNYDLYTGKVIKDFYRGNVTDSNQLEYYIIFDWGLQSVSKLGYPNSKWWQRSKTSRSDGLLGRTVWVKDRLVGATKCRITIDLSGDNYPDFFEQSGLLTIESNKKPNDVVPEFNQPPFI